MSFNRGSSTRRSFLGGVGAGVVATAGCLSSSEALSVSILPDVDPDTAIEQNVPLIEHLEEKVGIEIEFDPVSDYASMIQAMSSEHLDIAYFGGVSYVLASQRADARVLAVGKQDGSTEWKSVFIAHEESEIDSVEDLADDASELEFVLGDELSTSGSIMPTYYADQEYDLDVEEDFDSQNFLGAHDSVLREVSSGNSDAGALNSRIFDSQEEAGNTDGAVEIWRTPSFSNYPWAVGPTVDDDLADEIQQAFLTLHEDVPDEQLERLNVDQYVEAEHEDFADVEEAIELVGISQEDIEE